MKRKHETAILNVGEKIKRAREDKNYSQEYMAAQLGIQQGGFSRLEKKTSEITIGELYEIANILEKPITDFLPETPAIQNNQCHFNQQAGNVIHHYHYQMSDEQLKLLSQLVSANASK